MGSGRNRFLVIGASGFLGSRLLTILGPEATGTFWRTPVKGGVRFDIGAMRLCDAIPGGLEQFSHAFLLGGVTHIDTCARDADGTAKINVAGHLRLIDDLLAASVTPVFASSDAVFSDGASLKHETSPRVPALTYGKQKLAVENYLLERGAGLILRLPKVVGTQPGDGTLTDQWLTAIEAGSVIQCARDQVLSPVAVDDVLTVLRRAPEIEAPAVFNVCGPTALTRLDFLQTLVQKARALRDLTPKIAACNLRDIQVYEPRPLNTSMSSARIAAKLGMNFRDMAAVSQEAVERRYGARGAPSA